MHLKKKSKKKYAATSVEESADMFEIAPDILILILMFEYWIGLQFGMRPPQRKTKDVN
jgi:hypothetical protein